MEPREIRLKYNRNDFEELYFRNGKDKILNHDDLKKRLYVLVAICLVLIAAFFYYRLTGEAYHFLAAVMIIFCSLGFDLYWKAKPVLKWKKQVITYLDDLDKKKQFTIIVASGAFSLIQDEDETIEKWTEFKKAEFYETHIVIKSNTDYLIPRKAMTPEEFDFLKTIVSERIKNE